MSTGPRLRVARAGCVLTLALGLSACGRGASEPVAVRVGKTTVTEGTVRHWRTVSVAGRRGSRAQVLGFLISSAWTEGEAASLGVQVSRAEAEQQLDVLTYDHREGMQFARSPLVAKLEAALGGGVTRSDRVWLMRLDMLSAEIAQKRFAQALQSVTPAEIAAYYAAHKRRFVVPERRDLTWVVNFREPLILEAMREVRAGKSLLSVAKRVSLDPPTITGLELMSAPEKDFARNVFAAAPHRLAGPFSQGANRYFLEVTKVTPARQQSLAEVAGTIRSEVAHQDQRRAAGISAAAFVRTWTVRTHCHRGYIVAGCAGSRGPLPVGEGWPYSALLRRASAAKPGVLVAVKHVALGAVLEAGHREMTVYLRAADRRLRSSCYGACARLWPPVLTVGTPSAEASAIAGDVGSIVRADGTRQVTYFYRPLYFYAKDRNRGDTRGHGAHSFGSTWYALRTIGEPYETPQQELRHRIRRNAQQ
jgi:predicted lipoprotein with Yx(FWY)xxD motif